MAVVAPDDAYVSITHSPTVADDGTSGSSVGVIGPRTISVFPSDGGPTGGTGPPIAPAVPVWL